MIFQTKLYTPHASVAFCGVVLVTKLLPLLSWPRVYWSSSLSRWKSPGSKSYTVLPYRDFQ